MSSSREADLEREVERLKAYVDKLLAHCRRAGAWGYPLLDAVGTSSASAGSDGAP